MTRTVKITGTRPEGVQHAGMTNLCPEEFVEVIAPDDSIHRVLVSYDSCCDSLLANKRTIEHLGHQKSMHEFLLETVSETERQKEPQAYLRIRKHDGTTLRHLFVAVKDFGGGVLGNKTLAPVHPPSALQGVCSKLDRRGSSNFHVIIRTELYQ